MNKLIEMLRRVQWRVGRMHEHTCIPYKETRTSVGSIDLEYSNMQIYTNILENLNITGDMWQQPNFLHILNVYELQ